MRGENGWLMLGQRLIHLDMVVFIDLGESAALHLVGGECLSLTRAEGFTLARWIKDFGGLAVAGTITRTGKLLE